MSDIAWAGLAALALVIACFGLHARTLRASRPSRQDLYRLRRF